jgi:hypothetical protein
MATQIQLQSTNYNGQLADITFYPCSGGTISLGYQTIPYTYTNDNYEGTYDLFFSAFNQTCQLVITCPTPTPTVTPTNTATPTPTLTTTPTNTPTLTQTPTPSPGPAFDPDAAAYLTAVVTAGGTVDSVMSAATNNLYLALKSNGFYSRFIDFYPFLGGTAASHAINGKTPSSRQITFNGTWTHNVSGATGNGTNAYGITASQTINDFVEGDKSYVTYNTNPTTAGAGGWEGVWDQSSGNVFGISISPTNFGLGLNCLLGGLGTNTGNTGLYIGSVKTGTTQSFLYKNGSSSAVYSRTSNDLMTTPLYYTLNCLNVMGVPQYFNTYRYVWWGSSNYITSAEVPTLSSIINAYETALGRNTY